MVIKNHRKQKKRKKQQKRNYIKENYGKPK